MSNYNIGATKITDKIRVSSAAIFYEFTSWGIPYYQYETFIFSDDEKFKTRMFIWGTSSGNSKSEKLEWLTANAHRRISKIMTKKINVA